MPHARSAMQEKKLMTRIRNESFVSDALFRKDDGFYYLSGTSALRSFIYVDVDEPTSFLLFITEMTKNHHLHTLQDFELLGTSICWIFHDIAGQY